jgi:hypothetical protein
MPPRPTHAGRQRRDAACRPLGAALRPHVTVSNGVKALALVASTLGLAMAYATPSLPGLQLTAEAGHAPSTVRVATTSMPAHTVRFGVIGFTAQARPKPSRPAAAAPRTDRQQRTASRGIRRTGLPSELGLTQRGLVVLNAIRDHFPQIHSFGGFRAGDLDHGSGNAVDTMISSRSQGDAVASYVIAHASELNVKYVIWRQRIWMPSTGAWKYMSDRGSPTANHMDHVHVSVR